MSEQSNTTEEPVVIQTAIAEYSPTAAALSGLAHRFRGVVFDLTTTKGDKEARAARLELVKLRTGLETKRKEIKAPALERSRLIDSEANRINAFISELEIPIDEQIRSEEKRKEAERQRKIDEEQARVAALQRRIDDIKAVAVRAVGRSADEIDAKIKLVVAIEIGGDFQEFQAAADVAHVETLATLRDLRARAAEAEAEALRVKAEREELDRLRAEQKERDRIERERVTAEQRAEADRLKLQRAEMLRQQEVQEADLRAKREAQLRADAEAAAVREEADRKAAAEQARLNAQAESDRRTADALAAAARAKADQLAREAREAEQHRLDELVAGLRRQQDAAAAEQRRKDAEAAELRRQEVEREEMSKWEEQRAAARVEKAGPVLLHALTAVQDWDIEANALPETIAQCVEDAINEAKETTE